MLNKFVIEIYPPSHNTSPASGCYRCGSAAGTYGPSTIALIPSPPPWKILGSANENIEIFLSKWEDILNFASLQKTLEKYYFKCSIKNKGATY